MNKDEDEFFNQLSDYFDAFDLVDLLDIPTSEVVDAFEDVVLDNRETLEEYMRHGR